MRVVVALGGNALLLRNDPLDVATQRRNVAKAASVIAEICAEHEVIVTHGNGPQVGLLALQAESYAGVEAYPLDVLGAESEGMIGYLIEQELAGRLPGVEICTLLTMVAVEADDPAFNRPSKPIGPVYEEADADRLIREHNWNMTRDGDAYRRVVPSPEPQAIVEMATVRKLVDSGTLVVCAGGGGIPVIREPSGHLRGVEAVIDKDLTAAVLAEVVGADRLLLLTDVDGIYRDWPKPASDRIDEISVADLRAMNLPAGSMGPKAEAACRFAERTGSVASIGALSQGVGLLNRRAGTHVAGIR